MSTSALWALAALRDEERNAYQVWKYMQAQGIEITTPGVSNVLRTLELEKLVEAYKGFDTRETRIFRLTETGKLRAAVELDNLRALCNELSA